MAIRKSNFELMRLAAMLLIVVVHANFGTFGLPDREAINTSLLGSFGRMFLQHVCVIGVNLFILISGYFRINFKWKSFLNLVFYLCFWRVVVAAFIWYPGGEGLSWFQMLSDLNPVAGWFVNAYLGLVVLSPLLNAFDEKCTNAQLTRYVVGALLFELIVDQFLPLSTLFQSGLSLWSFIVLYYIGRLICRGCIRLPDVKVSILCSLGMSLVVAGVGVAVPYCFLSDEWLINAFVSQWCRLAFSYDSIPILLSSVLIFGCFMRIKLQSRFVNHLAKSAFAIFLFHAMPYYNHKIQVLAENCGTCLAILKIAGFIVIVFVFAILIDQIRQFLWKRILKVLPF